MNRDQLIQALRKLARKRGVHFELDAKKGKGSHYRVEFGDNWTTIQHDLNPGRIRRILRQLDLDATDIWAPFLGLRRITPMQYPLAFVIEDGDIAVSSTDMPELITAGSSELEAMEMAEDALAVVLLTYLEKGVPLPRPRKAKPGERMVIVPAATAAKIAVIRAFAAAGISKVELARRLGVAENEARRILDPNHATKLDKLDLAARALGRRIAVDLAA